MTAILFLLGISCIFVFGITHDRKTSKRVRAHENEILETMRVLTDVTQRKQLAKTHFAQLVTHRKHLKRVR